MHPSITEMLAAIDIDVTYRPDIKRSEIIELISDYHGIIVRSKTFIDKEILDSAPNLEFIGRAGAGLDKMDLEEIERRNIAILNAPEGNRDAVAEHVVGLILALLNNFLKGHLEIKNGIWDREGNRGFELSGQTVGIIGYGNMGTATAQRLQCFGCEVIAYDKYKRDVKSPFAKMVDLEELYEKADILSLHIPLTPETHYMCNMEFLSKFKKDIWFINTSRGPISAFKSLIAGLDSGKLKGAGLDVLENEKLEKLTEEQKSLFMNLVNRNNVILTPHVGGWSYESHVKINEVLTSKIKDYYSSFN